MSDTRHWLAHILNPGVPWWFAVPCNVLSGAAIVLLLIDSGRNLIPALGLLVPTAIALCGTALANWCHRES